MKQYLKMADVFCGDFHAKKMHDENGNGFSFMVAHCMEAEYAANAINSHDELVQINQELLAALEASVGLLCHFGDAYGCAPSNYIEYKVATKAIANAKGGAA